MTAFFFVPLLAVTWMFGFAVAAHAAHYFLTIVESSATGMARNMSWKGRPFREWIRDGVQWPDDLFLDYFAKTFYFAYIVGIWAVPAILTGRLIAGHTPWATVIAGSIFWLLFPIGLLSSLASATRWTPFWSGIVVAFFHRPAKVFGFYLLSAPVLGVICLLFDLILLHTESVSMIWSIALCPVAVVCFFIYARLLGRLGLVVSFTRPEVENKSRKRRVRKPKRPWNAYDKNTRAFGPKEEIPDVAVNTQPTDLPPLESLYDGPVTGYTVDYTGNAPLIEEPKPAPKMMYLDDDEEPGPLPVAPPPDISGTDRERIAAELAKPSERELELYLRERPTEPTNPYGAETVTFLFDPKTIEPWCRLTLGLIVMSLLQRALDMLRPI